MSPKTLLFKCNDEFKRSVLVSLTFVTQFACKSLSYKHQQKSELRVERNLNDKNKNSFTKTNISDTSSTKKTCA